MVNSHREVSVCIQVYLNELFSVIDIHIDTCIKKKEVAPGRNRRYRGAQ